MQLRTECGSCKPTQGCIKRPAAIFVNCVYNIKISQSYKQLCTRHSIISPRAVRKRANNNTSQQDFGTRKVYCVANVTFHAESKYAIKIFPSPTVFVQWPF